MAPSNKRTAQGTMDCNVPSLPNQSTERCCARVDEIASLIGYLPNILSLLLFQNSRMMLKSGIMVWNLLTIRGLS